MTNRQVFEKMKNVRPNTKISLTIADAPDYNETTHTTLVRMNNGAKFVLQDEDDSDVFAIPFAPDDTRVITNIDVLLHTPLFVNTRLRNGDPNHQPDDLCGWWLPPEPWRGGGRHQSI